MLKRIWKRKQNHLPQKRNRDNINSSVLVSNFDLVKMHSQMLEICKLAAATRHSRILRDEYVCEIKHLPNQIVTGVTLIR